MNTQSLKKELLDLEEENQSLLDQYEEVIIRANSLEVEAEIARLEFHQIFNAINDATWVLDNEKTILRINDSFIDLLKLKNRSDAIGKKCYDLAPSDLCNSGKCPFESLQNEEQQFEINIELETGGNKISHFWLTAKPLLGVANETLGIVVQYKDITKRRKYEDALKKANSKLKRLATVDGLTQLANRRFFDETLQKEWLRMRRERRPISLILCDVDFFKLYNDHYGHQEGDECLKAVAESMKNCIHRPSDLVARYGGEEFVVILPNTDSVGACHLAEIMRNSVVSMKRAHVRSKVNDFITLSFGVATVVPQIGGPNADNIIKTADDALYASKEAGRNLVTTKDLG